VHLQRTTEAPKVLGGFSLPAGSRCLELGCGHGAGTLLISQHFDCSEIVGVDIDPQLIEAARQYVASPPAWASGIKTSSIRFAVEDAAHLSFAEASFDAVFLFGVLNSVDDWKGVVREAHRVLKPGGVFSFKEAIRPPNFFYMSRLFFFTPIIGEQELQQTLLDTGFKLESFEAFRRQPSCFVRARKG
jgi:ubiquinone/menaquinone biosynthesis C-methylase UbiE